MKGAPARDSNSAKGDLGVLVDPDTGFAWNAYAGDSVFLEGAQDDRLKGTHVPSNVGLVIVKIDEWVAHRLFGAVVGDASAPFDRNDRGSTRLKLR